MTETIWKYEGKRDRVQLDELNVDIYRDIRPYAVKQSIAV